MRINFFTIISIFLAVLSFLLIYNRLGNSLSINKPSFFYFLIPISFLISSLASLFLSPKSVFFFSYSLILIIFISYSVEAFIKIVINSDIIKIRKSYFENNNFDSRNKFEILEEFEKKNLDKTISVPPQNFLNQEDKNILPLSGLSNKFTIMCNESGYFNSYLADRYGFNNNDKIYDENEIFSIFVGDSFTHGACVNNQNNLISNLKSRNFFKEKNILNLGYSGNGPLLSYAILKEYFNKDKNTKYVFWLYYEPNDLVELSREAKDSILNKYLNNFSYSQNLISKQDKVDIIINKEILNQKKRYNSFLKINTNVNKSKLISFLSLDETRRFIFKLTNRRYNKNIEIINLFSLVVAHFKNFSYQENFELIFVYLPGKQINEASKYYKDIIDVINRKEVKLIDLSTSSFYKKNSSYPKYGGHFNEKGYKKLSIEINNKLNQMQLLRD